MSHSFKGKMVFLGTKGDYACRMLRIYEIELEESDGSPYSIHPCVNKMYHDLWKVYWRDNFKRYSAEFVAKC